MAFVSTVQRYSFFLNTQTFPALFLYRHVFCHGFCHRYFSRTGYANAYKIRIFVEIPQNGHAGHAKGISMRKFSDT